MNKGEVAQAAWKGIIWRFLERCSSQLVSFIVSIILARLLLPEQYGIIAMTMISWQSQKSLLQVDWAPLWYSSQNMMSGLSQRCSGPVSFFLS